MQSSNETALRNHSATIARAMTAVTGRLAELDRRSPAKDAAAVADLREAVAALAKTHQRFAGRFYQTVEERGPDPNQRELQHGTNGLDPELQAELALQNAPAVSPGNLR